MPFKNPPIEVISYRGHEGEVRYDEKNEIYYIKNITTKTLLCCATKNKEQLLSIFQDLVDGHFEIISMYGKEAYLDEPDVCNSCNNRRDTPEELTICKLCGGNFCKSICGHTEDHVCILCHDFHFEELDYLERSE